MAPFAEHAVATVVSAQVKSYDEKSILVEAGGFTPVRWFLEHGLQPQDDKQPPKKRQKIDHFKDDQEINQSSSEEIPLFYLQLDFYFPETLQSKSPSAEAIADDVDFSDAVGTSVVPSDIAQGEDGVTLRLSLPKSKGHVLLIESNAIPEDQLSMLRMFTPSMRSFTRKQTPASVSSCTFTRSVGPLYTIVRLKAAMHWRSGEAAVQEDGTYRRQRPDQNVFLRAFPAMETEYNRKPWTPQDFYDSVPATSGDDKMDGIYDGVLESDLFPFQKRAVKWMLGREGEQSTPRTVPEFYERVRDVEGNTCFVNRLEGIVSREPVKLGDISGGGLFDEMGLGKTVELIALITLNGRCPKAALKATESSLHEEMPGDAEKTIFKDDHMREGGKTRDNYSGDLVTTSRATLIITPASILQQWQSELAKHAPALRVFTYQGIPNNRAKAPSQEQVIKDLTTKYDVVLATYTTLGREIHFAEDPPERNMRHQPKFERKRSPLVQIQWWRICLDEAQMVESGVTAAAKVACRLPRVHSWAVSGTPLKKNVQDLHGLLIFLRYSPFDGLNGDKIWKRLVDLHKPLFRDLFGCMALRHTKWHVRDELRLPAQKRVVVTVPFTIVEQQHYSTLFDEMCEEVGVNSLGAPLRDDWNPEEPRTIESMRTFLTRLRQTCLHPEVGGRNRKALGRGAGAGPLRTVGEVLEVMIEQNESSLRVEERAVITTSLQKAHIFAYNGEDEHRSEKALAIYEEARQTTAQIVKDARKRLASAQTADQSTTMSDSEGEDETTQILGKLRTGLRTALQLQHVCTFFAANSYYQMKTSKEEGSDEFKQLEELETSYYEMAKELRKEILSETSRKAEALMNKIQSGAMMKLPPIKDLQSMGGIESRRIVEKSDELFDIINQQQKVLEDWRGTISDLLIKPLVDDDKEDSDAAAAVTGEEYEDSTKQQDELFVYFDAFKAVHADLATFVTGEHAPLIDFEAKEYIKNCKRYFDDKVMEAHKLFVHAPELGLNLFKIRQKFRDERDNVGSVRGLIQEARALDGAMDWSKTRTSAEHAIVKQHIAALQEVFTSRTKVLAGLEKEVELFRQTQNQRVAFYRQLQEVSDDVQAYKEDLDETLDQAALAVVLAKEERAKKSLAEAQKKNRFLLHLREESGAQAGPRTCIICTSNFESGVLTVCGHQFCKDCLQHWFAQKRTCPMCKRALTASDLHDITFKPQELRAQEEQQRSGEEGEPSQPDQPSSSNTPPVSIYSDVSPQLLQEIKSIDLPTSYGTKIDTLGRHLHWIREHDPGAKSIIFSQFREFLDVLGSALKTFKLGTARLGRAGAAEKFKHDPSIDCLLLDAKTDSSGLTLVNATHVFICEPLIQTAVELQAIARVHRIGQTRATTVWMYLIEGTVEEGIYDISVQRRMQHVRERKRESVKVVENDAAIDEANSEEMQAAPLRKLLVEGKSGGELVGKDDLWRCLFGKAQGGGDGGSGSEALQAEVGRHLRGEAAEERRMAEA